MDNVINFEFISGARKNSRLLYTTEDKQIYMFKTNWKHKGTNLLMKNYVCYVKECKASVNFIEAENKCVVNKKEHCHITDQESRMKQFKVMNSIKTKVAKPNLKRTFNRTIFNETINENKETNLLYNTMQRHLRRLKTEALPKAPTSPKDIIETFNIENFMQSFGMCASDEKATFYKTTVIESTFSYTIFCSSSIGDLISKNISHDNRNFLIDSTFSIVPQCGYKQLLIIGFAQENHIFPFVFALMSNKTTQIYEHLFSYIKANIIDLNPKQISTDYETALRTALRKIYPNSKLNGCWFHYCQALRRKALQFKELAKIVRHDIDAKRILRKLMALGLLSPHDVVAAFNICKTDAYLHVKFLTDDGHNIFDNMFHYFERQWIKKVHSHF